VTGSVGSTYRQEGVGMETRRAWDEAPAVEARDAGVRVRVPRPEDSPAICLPLSLGFTIVWEEFGKW
jgi:hypothetical protein